ncbi:MAG: trypsin-like peptidase domain-containing protein [Acidobacteriota bacterium]
MTRATFRVLLAVLTLLAAASPALASKPVPRPDSISVVGHAQEYSLRPNLADAVESAGGFSWSHAVEVADAAFIKLRLTEFDLRPGDVLIVRSSNGRVVEELTGKGPKDARSFWTLSAFGNRLELELQFSKPYDRLPFRISKAMVGDAEMLESMVGAPPTKSICSPADFEDVVCYEADQAKWDNIYASVGVMNVGGNANLWCSGSNISASGHILTNYHCVPDFAPCSNAEFVFKYYRTGCNDGSPITADWVGFRCDETLVQSPFISCDQGLNDLDFSLNTVIGDPSSTFGFVEVDPTPLTSGEAIYIVQHPDGRPHEITHGSGADVVVDGTVLRYYNTLDTEGGSSGSPIYRESDDQLVGLHHCGGCSSAGVGNRGMLISDIYPHIQEYLCSQSLELTPVTIDDPVEVTGNGDAVLDPGETWSFVPRLRNRACSAVAGSVEADISIHPDSVGVTLVDAMTTFGDIAAGAVADGSAVRFTIDPAAPCGDEVVLGLTQVVGTGGPFTDVPEMLRVATGSVPEVPLTFHDFAVGMPGGWSIVDGGTGSGDAATWTEANPGNRNLLTPPFMIADSDALGSGFDMDEEMLTTTYDLSGYLSAFVQFEHNFRYWSGGGAEKADVDVRSSATGGSWVNLERYEGATTSGQVTLDLTPYIAADVQLRFHYYDATYDYWWAIDDLYVIGVETPQCSSTTQIFSDDFESGNLSSWTMTVP